jgi:5-methylcytosine-specific restriction endonuclease McrA
MMRRWAPGTPCCICGIRIWDRGTVTIEHLVKVSAGGTHEMDNLDYAHSRCNSAMRPSPGLRIYRRPRL